MRIVVFGLTISSSWGNGHATLWRGLCAALGRFGHHVEFYERNVPYYAATRDLTAFPGGTLRLYDDWDAIAATGRRSVAEAEASVITSYCPDGIAATRLVNEAGRGVRIFYDLDTPVTLSKLTRGEEVKYIGPSGLKDFDLVLSYTGGAALRELHDRLGARRVAPLYGHVDPHSHHPVAAVDHYRADLSYLGTYAPDRQDGLEKLFVEPARQCGGRRFLIGGAQYPHEFPWSSNIYFVRHLPPAEHPPFFSSSRMTLNVTRRDMAEMGWCPSGRLFEATACGTAVITDVWDGIDAFFGPGEVIKATSTEQVLHALNMEDGELRRIAAAGRDRTRAEHTSDRRAGELLAYIESACGLPKARTEVVHA